MLHLKLFTAILIAFSFAIGCSGENGGAGSAAIDACIVRGVAYFKEAGSYPTLQSAPNAGRSAEDVARERCSRTISAF